MKIYSYGKCSTCRNAVKYLQTKGLEPKVIDIIENPPSKSDLNKMLQIQDGNLKKLFNTSGQVYRELNLKNKIEKLSKEKAFELLSKNGKLVKRPFFLGKNKKGEECGLVGFKEEEWSRTF